MRYRNAEGFTLVELMITVAIIGVLAMIAYPQYAETLRMSQEATTKGNLAALKSAIGIYYADKGTYPTDDLTSLISGNYISNIPMRYVPPYHPAGNDVSVGNMAAMIPSHDAWFYVNDPTDTYFGTIMVNCIHQDLRGSPWSTN